MLSADAIVDLHDELTAAGMRIRRSRELGQMCDWLPASRASIAPTSTSGTSKTRLARPAPQTLSWPTSSAASTPPTNCATTSPKISTALCSTGLHRRVCLHPNAPLHSESPGLIIDRLSILALKIYHTREEAERPDATSNHAERNQARLAILEEQRADLAGCLDSFWRETLAGTRRFKLYRQLKMYNDPSSTPQSTASLVNEPLS